jgi:hypothetical protein
MSVIDHRLKKLDHENGLNQPLLEAYEDGISHDEPDTIMSVIEFVKDLLLSMIRFIKVAAIIAFIIHLWTQTCDVRTKQFGVLHELTKAGHVAITYHHDRVSSTVSYEHRNNRQMDMHEVHKNPP